MRLPRPGQARISDLAPWHRPGGFDLMPHTVWHTNWPFFQPQLALSLAYFACIDDGTGSTRPHRERRRRFGTAAADCVLRAPGPGKPGIRTDPGMRQQGQHVSGVTLCEGARGGERSAHTDFGAWIHFRQPTKPCRQPVRLACFACSSPSLIRLIRPGPSLTLLNRIDQPTMVPLGQAQVPTCRASHISLAW